MIESLKRRVAHNAFKIPPPFWAAATALPKSPKTPRPRALQRRLRAVRSYRSALGAVPERDLTAWRVTLSAHEAR